MENIITGNFSLAWEEARGNARIWLYFIFFAIGLAILLLTGLVILLCCCCSNCCPPKCCRQPEDKPYTRGQIKVPTCILLLLGLVITGTMVAGKLWVTQLLFS